LPRRPLRVRKIALAKIECVDEHCLHRTTVGF
jgi:hypothetical protein